LRRELLSHRITDVIAAHSPTQQIRQVLKELVGLAA